MRLPKVIVQSGECCHGLACEFHPIRITAKETHHFRTMILYNTLLSTCAEWCGLELLGRTVCVCARLVHASDIRDELIHETQSTGIVLHRHDAGPTLCR